MPGLDVARGDLPEEPECRAVEACRDRTSPAAFSPSPCAGSSAGCGRGAWARRCRHRRAGPGRSLPACARSAMKSRIFSAARGPFSARRTAASPLVACISRALSSSPRCFEVGQDDVEQVQVQDAELAVMAREAIHHHLDVLADLQLVLGRIVEDVAGDLVADALAREEGLAGDTRQDLVEAARRGSSSFHHLHAAKHVGFAAVAQVGGELRRRRRRFAGAGSACLSGSRPRPAWRTRPSAAWPRWSRSSGACPGRARGSPRCIRSTCGIELLGEEAPLLAHGDVHEVAEESAVLDGAGEDRLGRLFAVAIAHHLPQPFTQGLEPSAKQAGNPPDGLDTAHLQHVLF